jgi:hypothetical protein
MQEVTRDIPARTEGELRLHAMVRAVLSPGIWFVLAAQLLLMFALQWRVPEDAAPLVSTLAIFLTAAALMLFFYLQAGAFQALSQGREALPAGEVVRAGKTVFTAFVWLILKAGLLFAVAMNVLMLVALLLTGSNLEGLTQALTAYFGPMTGVLAFVFVYWLPLVFVQREFRLLPGLRASLRIAWARLSHSAFLALMVLVPALVAGLLPADSPVLFNALVSLVTGILGWIAYIYCVDALRQRQHAAPEKIPV